jgi:hypothetical protein
MEALETITKNDLTAKLYQDEDAESPRDWDNLGTMVYWHRNYILGDVDGSKEYESPQAFIEQANRDGWECLPLALYDHSGLTMWVGSRPHAFDAQGWDSGQVGFIYVTPEKIRKEYSCKHITAKTCAKVRQVLKSEVKAFDQFLTGDIYGYMIEDEEGEHIDSCWGFFGHEYAKTEMQSALDYCAKTRTQEDASAAQYMAL